MFLERTGGSIVIYLKWSGVIRGEILFLEIGGIMVCLFINGGDLVERGKLMM